MGGSHQRARRRSADASDSAKLPDQGAQLARTDQNGEAVDEPALRDEARGDELQAHAADQAEADERDGDREVRDLRDEQAPRSQRAELLGNAEALEAGERQREDARRAIELRAALRVAVPEARPARDEEGDHLDDPVGGEDRSEAESEHPEVCVAGAGRARGELCGHAGKQHVLRDEVEGYRDGDRDRRSAR